MLGEDAGHLLDGESAFGEPLVVMADELDEGPGLVGVPAVDVDDIRRPSLGCHEGRHIRAEPAGRDRLTGTDASGEECGAGPAVEGHRAEQRLEPAHLELAMYEILRDICEIQDRSVTDYRRGLLEHGDLRKALRGGMRRDRASCRSWPPSRPCADS